MNYGRNIDEREERDDNNNDDYFDSDRASVSSLSSQKPSSSSSGGDGLVGKVQRSLEKLVNDAQDAYTIRYRPDYRIKIETKCGFFYLRF